MANSKTACLKINTKEASLKVNLAPSKTCAKAISEAAGSYPF